MKMQLAQLIYFNNLDMTDECRWQSNMFTCKVFNLAQFLYD